MIGLLLVSHGTMAEGMLDAARMIVGPIENALEISLNEMDAVEGLMDRISAAVDVVDQGDGVLILVDAFGASPFNASARVAVTRQNIEVVTGMNLPMLLELAIQRENQSLQECVQTALQAGTSSIRTLPASLREKPSNT